MSNAPLGPQEEDSHGSAHRNLDSAHENVHESMLGQSLVALYLLFWISLLLRFCDFLAFGGRFCLLFQG